LRGATGLVIVGNEQLGVGGDLIMAVDGNPVEREDALVRVMARKRVGDTIDLTIFRNGRKLNIRMTLRRAPLNQ
jgi:S1-C subfamily serine protease